MILGVDVSTYFEEKKAGARYFSAGKQVDPLEVFKGNGVTHMRIRIWNDPYSEGKKPYKGGTCGVENFLRLASLAKEYGYRVVPDFHYSDFWADPGKQFIPKGWANDSYETLLAKVAEFTKSTLLKLKGEGIGVEMLQIGNEITNGMLWPIGKLIDNGEGERRGNYDCLCGLLKAGIAAAKEVYPHAKIILHLERSGDAAVYQEFFEEMGRHGVPYDIIGASYYPYWHGSFKQLFDNLDSCKAKFKKEIMIMELGYGFTLEDYILTNNGAPHLVINEEKLKEMKEALPYPLNEDGQAAFIEEFLALSEKHGVEGVFYWEPLWIPGEDICWASTEGQRYINEVGKSQRNEWANQCLYDYEGNALKALDKFKIKGESK